MIGTPGIEDTGTDDRQYFDRLKVADGQVWAVDDIANTETPLEIRSIGWTEGSTSPTRIVLHQDRGGDWYSRTTYDSAHALHAAAAEMSRSIHAAGRPAVLSAGPA